jgi:ribonuclease HII
LVKRRKASPCLKLNEEKIGFELGYSFIAGIDEVGRGCLAGPVVASAVIMPSEINGKWQKRIRDSKLLTHEQREELCPFIHEAAVSIGTGIVSPDFIDNFGMTRAVHRAMLLAVEQLLPQPDYVLIDYLTIPELSLPQKGVEDGDTLCFSIACASIVAKVFRDHMMINLDRKYPGYGFSHHKGYGTEEHICSLKKLGPSPIHRWLFSPVRNLAQLSFEDILEMTEDVEENGT